MRKELDKVTLIVADTKNYAQAIHSLMQSLQQIKPIRTIFFTDIDLYNIYPEIEIIKIDSIKSKEEYSRWIMRELWRHIDTEFILIQQWDSWVLSAERWTDEFMSVDYIGASWLETDGFSVGNGGFSLRSKELMRKVANDGIIISTHPEDNMICKVYRPYLEAKYGFKWASEELADKFAFELRAPTQKTFGYHSYFHQPFKEVIMITRKAALGDIVALEPLLHHFHKKGYRVVLNTLPQFFNLFVQHYFKVYHPQELDSRIPVREINLDMGYEITPKRLHLESYYEMAGVKDGELRNPKLTLDFNPKLTENKLFPKYVVLHIDIRVQKGRNIYGINWDEISEYLNSLGYAVVIIGKGEHPKIKRAIEMNTPTELMMMWVIGSADVFIGVDSGPSNVAVALGVKAIIFFGSVNPDYIYPDLSNIKIIQHADVCRLPKCWHSVSGCEGIECVETTEIPPCTKFDTVNVIEKINECLL